MRATLGQRSFRGVFSRLARFPETAARFTLKELLTNPRLSLLFRALDRSTLKARLLQRARQSQRSITLTDWYANYRCPPRLLRRFREADWGAEAPFFRVIVRRGSEAQARRTLQSITEQTYPNYNLNTPQRNEPPQRPHYVCFVNAGDVLEPHALHRLAFAVCCDAADVLYADDVVMAADGKTVLAVNARPAFSYDEFLTRGQIGSVWAVRDVTLSEAVTGATTTDNTTAPSPPGGEAGDFDLLLRVLEVAGRVSHIPDILVKRCSVSQDHQAADRKDAACVNAVRQHFGRLGIAADVQAVGHGCRDIRFALQDDWRVAIIIPAKNRRDLLEPCIRSLERTIDLRHADIVVIDHDSDDAETMAYLQELRSRHRVFTCTGPFNFSAMMNQAAQRLAGTCTHYLFLNNDTEALTPGWLEHMMGYGQRPDVGIVNALLLYPDGTVQNAGVNVGACYRACHVYRELPVTAAGSRLSGPDGLLLAAREQSAVTAACLLIRAEVFARVGGFDEHFAVGYGDTDLCLRVAAAGFKIIFDPHATLLHHESASRGKSETDPHPDDTRRFRRKHWPQIIAGDPFYSPLHHRISPGELDPRARSGEIVRPRTRHITAQSVSATSRTS